MTELLPKNGQYHLRPPAWEDLPHLRQLWKDAFGDEDTFLDLFFRTAFSPARCRCLVQNQVLLGAAYWLDCKLGSRSLAYVYAVAIVSGAQGQGLGTILMDRLHSVLTQQGYDGVILVPGNEGLQQFYRRFGYRTVAYHKEFTAAAGKAAALTKIDAQRYGQLRRRFLPENGILQEGENLALLDALADFYEGDGFVAAVSRDDQICLELLGREDPAGGIAAALGLDECRFRTPGLDIPYAMGKTLTPEELPDTLYLGFGFD